MKHSILFNDISGLGKCSLSVQLPILNHMNISTSPVPTGVFSCQSGFPSFHYTDLQDQVSRTIKDFIEMNIKFDGLIAGFMMSKAQLEILETYLLHPYNKNNLILIDPILGDDGKQFSFFNREYLRKMQEIVDKADIITPNLTELCLLSNVDYEELISHSFLPLNDYMDKISDIAGSLFSNRLQKIIVTGIRSSDKDNSHAVYNLLVSQNTKNYTTGEFKMGNYSGTGDILAALMFGYLVNGTKEMEALKKTSEILQRIINQSVEKKMEGRFGTSFETELKNIRL